MGRKNDKRCSLMESEQFFILMTAVVTQQL